MGKGDKPRPAAVPDDEVTRRWEKTFGKTEHETEVCEIHDRVFPCLPCKIEGGPNADRS